MRRLRGLLSQAAAAGRAAARTSSSHVRGSNGFASGTGGVGDGFPLPREWLRRLWTEELKKQKEAARGWGKRAEVAKAEVGGQTEASPLKSQPPYCQGCGVGKYHVCFRAGE